MAVHIVSAATVAAHGAKCLDGSPPAYLVREGTGANASKYVVFLEGGGWCFSVSDCEKRRRGGLGSSARFIPGSTKKDYGGVMAISSTTNPDFHGYTMVFVHYCDGSSMSSFRPNPIKTSDGQDMWFRGKANLAAVLDELRQDHGLGEASEVILSGGSAGGLAVYYHLDYVAAFVRGSAPKARVTGFPDAGFFADLKNTKGQYEYRGYYQTADSTCWNTTLSGGTNAACLAANPGGTSWKCLMAEYLTDYIATPMYVMNAAFDVYQVQNVLDVGCVPNNCSATQIAAMVAYRKEYLGSSIAHLVARAPLVGHGAFIDSCLVHEQNVDYCSGGNPHAYNCAGWLTTKVLGVSPQQAYSRWYFGGSGAGTNTSTGKQHTDNYNYNYNLTIDPSAAIGPAPGSNPSCPWNFH